MPTITSTASAAPAAPARPAPRSPSSAPADGKSVAAIEKLIGQTIAWMRERRRRARPSHATSTRRAASTRARRRPPAAAQWPAARQPSRERPARRRPRRSDDARPAPAPAARPDRWRTASSHLPAFLLRPRDAEADGSSPAGLPAASGPRQGLITQSAGVYPPFTGCRISSRGSRVHRPHQCDHRVHGAGRVAQRSLRDGDLQ